MALPLSAASAGDAVTAPAATAVATRAATVMGRVLIIVVVPPLMMMSSIGSRIPLQR